MLVDGKWHLSFWAKSEGINPKINVRFLRFGAPAFFEKEIALTPNWQEYDYEFEAKDDGPIGMVLFALKLEGAAVVYFDDFFLGQSQSELFRKDFLEVMQRLKPSYIRDHQGQLTDTLKNRLAGEYARRCCSVAGLNEEQFYFPYSIPDLLELCRLTNSDPWIVVPVTFTEDEARELGDYLGREALGFKEVILEFGNENWNLLFRQAGIPNPELCAKLANETFLAIEKGNEGRVKLVKTLGSQEVYPYVAHQMLENAPILDAIGSAAYYFSEMNKEMTSEEVTKAIFSPEDTGLLKIKEDADKHEKRLVIYEFNMHTTQGTATGEERNPWIAGAISATSFAKQSLLTMQLKSKPAIVFQLAQMATSMGLPSGYISLWGIVRDLWPTKRLRPTGLAMSLINSVVKPNSHNILSEDQKIEALAFSSERTWSFVVLSMSDEPTQLELNLPKEKFNAEIRQRQVVAKSLFDTNEDNELVKIEETKFEINDDKIIFELPPYGLTTLEIDKESL